MAYCTKDDILNIIPEQDLINLTVDTPVGDDVVNEAQLSSAIDYADSCINGYLRSRYDLPLSVIPDEIVKLCADIAVYRLYMRRPQSLPEHIKDNYKESIELLKNIQKGVFIIDTPQEHPETTMPALKPTFKTNKTARSRIFDANTMGAFGLGGVQR